LLPSSNTDYDLHHINANNIDNIIISTPDLTHKFFTDDCDYIPSFYVEIADISGCVSRSSISSVQLQDTLSPLTPEIKDVSVDIQGNAVVSWIPSLGADFYIVYIQDQAGAWITLDTIDASLNTFIYNNSLAGSTIESYSVKAIDSCGNTRSRSQLHNSIFLQSTSDACDYSISLEWNDYINWNGGTNHYNVLIAETDSSGNVINSSIRVQGNTNLVLPNISSSASYAIVVEAFNFDSTFKASSNLLNIDVAFANKPTFNYLEYATVNHDDGSVFLSCIVDLSAVVDRFDVYRSKRDENIFSKIGEIESSGNSPINYSDMLPFTDSHFYQYRIYPVDTCGVTLSPPPYDSPTYSNDTSFAQTILLETEVNVDYSDFPSLDGEYTNTLSFNEYDRWLGSVSEYRLYRSVNREPFDLLPIHVWDRVNKPNEDLSYIDIVTEFGAGNGRFCYYIEAVEGNSTPFGAVLEGSLSNLSCISQVPVIFVPNTFTPNGDEHNELFRPITYFVSEIGYSFSIFNRNGEKIFETNDPQKGWDGTYQGSHVKNGSYVYHLQYINSLGVIANKQNYIILTR
ncbi:MAG: gliding motility-associated C-terminal domain-containing protein, partial [Flavobacteriales bacterium]|nr:gliding motility-associated C-terminal domain-containing protein [Flavobacteriales bacterium]